MINRLASDLDHVLAHTIDLWDELRGQRLFITGGTGFFGCWLLESFAWANDKLGLNASALVLTRDIEAFKHKAPHLASHPAIRFQCGDVCNFDFPVGSFSYVIHAATDASAQLNTEQPLHMLDTIINGTRHVLDMARRCEARKVLLTSSGAIYGKQPTYLTHVPEGYSGGPDPLDPQAAYAEGKRTAELLTALYARHYNLRLKIARCFAFVGPYLPLDIHYAIGNFIRDGLHGGPIRVNGDGTPYRSYLYAADLAIWLWTILFKGEAGRPYNVGSAEDLTIAELAERVSNAFAPRVEVKITQVAQPGRASERYVPDVTRATQELDLRQWVTLSDSLQRTILWHRTTIQ
ncbi:dTDP-glucose 4,6-dehydratase [Anaerolineae bacterium]|nr:dTDP-glucose 4,6-dehydratase [Anaerolineae bacterium]